MIKLMNSTMAAISVFVAFVLGCLIVYASNFLMKRRKKEFGIYMLLGMEKGRIARIIMTETIIIGLVSLVLGLTVGIIASQGMSILVAKLFEADMTKYQFVVSYSAIGKTVIYFVIMYLVVLVLDTFVVGKAKLIDLLHAAKKISYCSRSAWNSILSGYCRCERYHDRKTDTAPDWKRSHRNVSCILVCFRTAVHYRIKE